MTAKPLFKLIPGKQPVALMSVYNNEQTSITVYNGSVFEEPTNHITIFDADGNYVTLEYTMKMGNVLSGISYVEGNNSITYYPNNCMVARTIDAYDFDAIHEHISGTEVAVAAHLADSANPHSVSKAQVGLGNADNTSDLDKPVSTATQVKLDEKANVIDFNAHTTNKSNPHEVTKAQVGLGNADNTSDVNKPVSTATQTALNKKVDKVTGSSLVPDTKVTSYDNHIASTSNPHSVTKSQVGLGNVDNTSDVNKPVSTATQTALNKKVDKVTGSSLVPDTKVTAYDAHIVNKSNPHSVTKAQVGLGNTVNGAQINVIESIKKNGVAQTVTNKAVDLVLSKSDVGLGNVDNTSDTTKANTSGNPIHDAIAAKAPTSHASAATTYGVASATNYGHPKATSASPSNASLSAAVGTDNGLYARGDHSHAKETFIMNGITINRGDWVADPTYRNYPYKATISNSSITASHVPFVVLSLASATTGDIAPIATTNAGSVAIYSSEVVTCVIDKIAFIKE